MAMERKYGVELVEANSTVSTARREDLRWRRSPTEKTFGGRQADIGVAGKRRGVSR